MSRCDHGGCGKEPAVYVCFELEVAPAERLRYPHGWRCHAHTPDRDVIFERASAVAIQQRSEDSFRTDLGVFLQAYRDMKRRAPGIFAEAEADGRAMRMRLGATSFSELEAKELEHFAKDEGKMYPTPKLSRVEVISAEEARRLYGPLPH